MISACIKVCLMSCCLVPATREVIAHQVPEVEVTIHVRDPELLVVDGTAGSGNGQEEMEPIGVGSGILVECSAGFLKEEDKVLCLGCVLRVLPVNVEAVETKVCNEFDSGASEGCAALGG